MKNGRRRKKKRNISHGWKLFMLCIWFGLCGLKGFLRVATINAGINSFVWADAVLKLPSADKNVLRLIILIISNCIYVYTFTSAWIMRNIFELTFTAFSTFFFVFLLVYHLRRNHHHHHHLHSFFFFFTARTNLRLAVTAL